MSLNNPIQPRGTNGHQPGEYAEHIPTPPGPEARLLLGGLLSVPATDIQPGDLVHGRYGGLIGTAVIVAEDPFRPGFTRITFADESTGLFGSNELVTVGRSEDVPVYVVDGSKSGRLAAAAHARATTKTLELAASSTTDSTIRLVVLSHPQATALAIDLAYADSTQPNMAHAALDNPATATETVQRILDHARAHGQEAFVDDDDLVLLHSIAIWEKANRIIGERNAWDAPGRPALDVDAAVKRRAAWKAKRARDDRASVLR